jgi:hypothetical protein
MIELESTNWGNLLSLVSDLSDLPRLTNSFDWVNMWITNSDDWLLRVLRWPSLMNDLCCWTIELTVLNDRLRMIELTERQWSLLNSWAGRTWLTPCTIELTVLNEWTIDWSRTVELNELNGWSRWTIDVIDWMRWLNLTAGTVRSILGETEVRVANFLSSRTTKKVQLNQPVFYQYTDIKVI